MKKLSLTAFLLALLLAFSSCMTLTDVLDPKEKLFTLEDYPVSFTATTAFKEVSDRGEWDIQITDGRVYFGVMAYDPVDLSEGQTPEEIYKLQNDHLFGRRENVQVMVEENTSALSGKSITHTRYSAEREGSKNYYESYLVTFGEDQTFCWVLITGLPSYIEKEGGHLRTVVESLSLTE